MQINFQQVGKQFRVVAVADEPLSKVFVSTFFLTFKFVLSLNISGFNCHHFCQFSCQSHDYVFLQGTLNTIACVLLYCFFKIKTNNLRNRGLCWLICEKILFVLKLSILVLETRTSALNGVFYIRSYVLLYLFVHLYRSGSIKICGRP